MINALPFYSYKRGIAVENVYHSHPTCQIAESIPLENRLLGKGPADDWPECRFCLMHHGAWPLTRFLAPLSRPAPDQL
jgi:hypothetical protein